MAYTGAGSKSTRLHNNAGEDSVRAKVQEELNSEVKPEKA